LEVTLIWRTQSPEAETPRLRVEASSGDSARLQATEEIYLQLRDEAGKVWAESPPAPVLAPQAPSPVEGYYRLDLPADIPRGLYQLWASLEADASTALNPPTPPATGGNRTGGGAHTTQNQQWRHFANLPVGQQQPKMPVTNLFEASFDNRIMLRGFDLNKSVLEEGDSLTLTLHWQSLNPASYSYTTFVHLIDPAGVTIAQRDLIPGEGQWPTDTWYPGEWITDQIELSLPDDLPPGNYALLVGWYYWQTGERLPVLSDNGAQDTVLLKEIEVQSEQSNSGQK
jgi:hypothetical protein